MPLVLAGSLLPKHMPPLNACSYTSSLSHTSFIAGGARNRKHNVLSSVDMNALFDTVAKEALPQEIHADDSHPHAISNSLPHLLLPSNTLADALFAPIPDPFHDKQTPCSHAVPVNVHIHSERDLHALDSVCARACGARTRAMQAHSEGLIRPSGPARRLSSVCHLSAAESVALHSEEAHAEAAACQIRLAGARQPCLSANCTSSMAQSSSSGTKHVAANVRSSAPAAVTDPEAQSSSMDAAVAVPAAQDMQKLHRRLTHAEGPVESLHLGFNLQPVRPHSQEASNQQELKQRVKPGLNPETLKTSNSSCAASILGSSWPRVSHVSKLRHGEQLRRAAAEAAAAAAGQAARAESAVRLHTPPTIAFHSAAAKHAMLAAEAAAADAAVTANSTAVASPKHRVGHCTAQLLGLAGQLPAPALRGGRSHASAPTSPVRCGRRHSSALQANQGLLDLDLQYAGRSRDSADVGVHDNAQAQHQHACSGKSFDMHELLGKDVLLGTASAPATPAIMRAAAEKGTARQQQQLHVALREPSLSHDSNGLLADAQCHHMPQKQSMHGRQMEASAPQRGQHAQQATWEQEGIDPMEDPFKASEQFPICPELCLPLPNSGKQDSQQAFLLTDCTNQLPGRQSHHCQSVRPSPSFHSLQVLPSRPDAAETSRFKGSMGTQQRIYQKGDRRRCEQALSMPAEFRGGGEPAAELLSSLTEDEFWEVARAELLDTAEPVRHRSCVGELDSECPITMRGLPVVADKEQHTPQPRLYTGPFASSGISPLLGKSSI